MEIGLPTHIALLCVTVPLPLIVQTIPRPVHSFGAHAEYSTHNVRDGNGYERNASLIFTSLGFD